MTWFARFLRLGLCVFGPQHSVGSNQYAHQRAWKDGREGMGNAGARSTGTSKYLQTHRSAMDSTTDRGNQHLKKYHL